MSTYYKVVTFEYMRSNLVIGPMLITAESKPKNSKVQTKRGTKYRSRIFPQMAEAIANQWASFILDDMAKQR